MTTFTSSFAPHIEAMLQWRTSLGHSPRDMRNAMTGFDRFCASHHRGQTVLTRELATAWCRDTATGTWGAYRSRAVRELGKYLQLVGVDGFILPSAWIARPARGLAHMFTDAELAAFFQAADSINTEYRSPFREYTIPVIFRLILGAGLRPPEARRLRRHDVDPENAMVMIERSKRNKDRRVPVTGDLAGLLARFDHLADLRHPDREWFFQDQHGRNTFNLGSTVGHWEHDEGEGAAGGGAFGRVGWPAGVGQASLGLAWVGPAAPVGVGDGGDGKQPGQQPVSVVAVRGGKRPGPRPGRVPRRAR
jgi:integrase